jgi:hypothetical protein
VAFNAETQVCVGDKFVFQVIVTLDPSASLASLDVTRDGGAQSVGRQNPTTWSGSFLADAEGEVELVATGTDSNGTSDTARHYIKVISCDDTVPGSTPDDPTPETKNSAPVVDVRAPECVEGESEGPTKVTVTITADDVDRDQMSVVLSGGSGSRTIPTGRYTINGSGSQSITFEVDYQDRGSVFTFTGTADDGQATGSDTATIRVDYPGGCDQTPDSSSPDNSSSVPNNPGTNNTAPTVTITTKTLVEVCKSGSNTSVPVTIKITVNDPQGDSMAITLATYNKTTRLGTAARAVGSVVGSGSVTATETFTAAQIGQTIELIARAADATLTGIDREDIEVVEQTTGCTAKNTAPKVSYTLTSTYDEKNSTCSVKVTATDAENDLVYIGDGSKFVRDSLFTGLSPRSRTYSIKLSPGDTGNLPSHFAVDQNGASTALNYPITVRFNAPIAGNTPSYSCVRA